MEGGEVRDRELAHHDRERQERCGQGGGADIREDDAERDVVQRAPRLCDASVNVCTSIERKPASSEKNMYGNARITYAAARKPHGCSVEPRRRPLEHLEQADDHHDGRNHERDQSEKGDHRPQPRHLQVDQVVVGTKSARLITIVSSAMMNEILIVFQKSGLCNTQP